MKIKMKIRTMSTYTEKHVRTTFCNNFRTLCFPFVFILPSATILSNSLESLGPESLFVGDFLGLQSFLSIKLFIDYLFGRINQS